MLSGESDEFPVIQSNFLFFLIPISTTGLELTCRSQANRVAPLALGNTVICWNVSRSWTWMLFSVEKLQFLH